ncbi:MAG: hypothetical protein J6V44_02615 [Methanobrevibacter sp.]|nr:hypothetical protein [Methanobrevibacter sp.]
MKNIFLILLFAGYSCSYSQNAGKEVADPISNSFIPKDYDQFWRDKKGCGISVRPEWCITEMDKFRYSHRRGFSNKELGNYYLCRIIQIDIFAGSSYCKFTPICDDSIMLATAKCIVYERYYSPYDKKIMFPIPWDIENDVQNNYRLYKELRCRQMLENIDTMYFYMVLTIEEWNDMKTSMKWNNVLLYDRGIEKPIDIEHGIIVTEQFFTEGNFDVSELYSIKQIARYWELRYLEMYYSLYGKHLSQVQIFDYKDCNTIK